MNDHPSNAPAMPVGRALDADALRSVLMRRHGEVEAHLWHWERCAGQVAPAPSVNAAVRVLVMHFVAMEHDLYPLFEQCLPDGLRLVAEQLDEVDHLETLLEQVLLADPADPWFWPMSELIISGAREHLAVEAEMCRRFDSACNPGLTAEAVHLLGSAQTSPRHGDY